MLQPCLKCGGEVAAFPDYSAGPAGPVYTDHVCVDCGYVYNPQDEEAEGHYAREDAEMQALIERVEIAYEKWEADQVERS